MIDRLAYITIQLTRDLEGLSQQDTLCQETQQKAEESFVAYTASPDKELRWTMASIIKLDENTYYEPGVNVPMYHISGVELRQGKYEAAEYQKSWDTFSPYLVKGGDGTGKPIKKPCLLNTSSYWMKPDDEADQLDAQS
ncbi:hypothetical protein LTR99_006251 [Exophiala xenobiotica]|uniref:Uncharacterized protein n=1 Tax=Vermiconidia calcicola TaxID=1690605 RepID=A0AAV9Q743_9PEZI|nr:hypothetical protein LTR41_008099 [Exophiala xenobiotica]KAK5534197.1 hypothetical protein LTR23_008869 [Chaetothyriales sp. CCFEE 6169]KAK5537422.1 hypothetical protein LTR25_004673 [Vermiconidia calcicola]KAK5217248.1 hypothetical protein LTR72_009814 [Exophiala xenobiotica]KAK5241641.1 hypothetical protein LTS06_011991 [Exophiala xenobiotica]